MMKLSERHTGDHGCSKNGRAVLAVRCDGCDGCWGYGGYGYDKAVRRSTPHAPARQGIVTRYDAATMPGPMTIIHTN